MTDLIFLDEIKIAGFRAYLREQSFRLYENGRPMNIAIFAPNAKGKSSFVDAFEFFFSTDGTLARLGGRRGDNFAGRQALEHVEARSQGIDSHVSITFRRGRDPFGSKRMVMEAGSEPECAKSINAKCKLPFIIRGYELRRFVDVQSAEHRYDEVAKWFSLDALVRMQQNLRNLRSDLKAEIEIDRDHRERLKDLHRLTRGAVVVFEEEAILRWFNNTNLKPLDSELELPALKENAPVYNLIRQRKFEEDRQIGIEALRVLNHAISKIYSRSSEAAERPLVPTGTLISYETALDRQSLAEKNELEERMKVSSAVFGEIWTVAERVIADTEVPVDACPVCATPLDRTPYRTRQGICEHLRAALADLERQRAALTAFRRAANDTLVAATALRESLAGVAAAFRTAGYAEVGSVRSSLTALQQGPGLLDATTRAGLKHELSALHERVEAECNAIRSRQGESTYNNALRTLEGILELNGRFLESRRKHSALMKIYRSLDEITQHVDSEIRDYIQAVIDTLGVRTNLLYQKIHGNIADAPPIRIELPRPEDRNQRRLSLLVDFAPNRLGVVPQGYLSDSQIHTLVLCFRLAAIMLLNREFLVVILDDVVTSYDADHRKTIAATISDELAGFQTIIVTHDQRFFQYLLDHLPEKNWLFRRITTLELGFGPKYHDHMITEEMIERRWAAGESAANEIRQAEEEWLLNKCREFGAKVRIRETQRAFQYERSELAQALHKALKHSRVAPPAVTGVANNFLISLQKGEVENFGSHFSDDPCAWAAVGDERRRWKEFKEFCEHFRCAKCKHAKFKRPHGMKRVVCAKCEHLFEM